MPTDEFGFDPCIVCGFHIYHNRDKRPAETLLCIGSCDNQLPLEGFVPAKTPITKSRGKSLANGGTKTLSSWDAAQARARERKRKEASVSDVTETPDLGLDPEADEELPDEEWEASAHALPSEEHSPESAELDEDADELEEAEAETEAEQPEAQPVTGDDEAEVDEPLDADHEDEPEADEPEEVEAEEEAEEKPAKAKRGKGKGKAKAKGKKAEAEKPKRTRDPNSRERGALELDVKSVTDAYDEGDIELEEGQTLTPHRIAKMIQERDGLEKPPSTGAVTNVIKKWDDVGYALTTEKPFAYKRKSAKGEREGLDSLKEKAAEKAKKERAKAKAASE